MIAGQSYEKQKSKIETFLIATLKPYSEADASTWTASTEIKSIGVDSFDFVEIIFKVEDEYQIDIDYNANLNFATLNTIGDLATHIVSALDRKIAA